MSRLEEYHLYDQAAVEALVLGFRRACGDPRALRKLLREAPEPRWPPTYESELRASLARLREMNAPEVVIESCRRQLEPRTFLLERLRRGEALAEWEILDLALRAKKAIPRQYQLIEWIADAEGRRAGPTTETSAHDWDPFSSTNPTVCAALFGTEKLLIGGVAALGGERQWVHSVASLPRVRRFFEALLELPPPPLEDYRRWYPHLHALRFEMVPEAQVPAEGQIAWEYAAELANAARAIRGLGSMLRNCERRGWCVQILCE